MFYPFPTVYYLLETEPRSMPQPAHIPASLRTTTLDIHHKGSLCCCPNFLTNTLLQGFQMVQGDIHSPVHHLRFTCTKPNPQEPKFSTSGPHSIHFTWPHWEQERLNDFHSSHACQKQRIWISCQLSSSLWEMKHYQRGGDFRLSFIDLHITLAKGKS